MSTQTKDRSRAEATAHIAASPERVWELVGDIHLIASLSQEVQEVAWLDGAVGPAVGARFRAHNAHAVAGEWDSVSRVAEYDPPRRWSWAVGDPENPTATWCFELTPRDGGTDLTQRYERGPGPAMLDRLLAAQPERAEAIIAFRLAQLQDGIDANLAALGELA